MDKDLQEYSKLMNYIERNIRAQKNRVGEHIDIPAFIRKIQAIAPDMKCPVCERQMLIDRKAPTKHKLHIEHLLPVSRGGSNRIENLFPLCGDCNISKGYKQVSEWYFGNKVAALNNAYHGDEVTERPPTEVKLSEIREGQYYQFSLRAWNRDATARGWQAPFDNPDYDKPPWLRVQEIYKRIAPVSVGGLWHDTIVYTTCDNIPCSVAAYMSTYWDYYKDTSSFNSPYYEIVPKRYWPNADITPTYQVVSFWQLEVEDKFYNWSPLELEKRYIKLRDETNFFFRYNAKDINSNQKTTFKPNDEVLVDLEWQYNGRLPPTTF